MPRTFVLFDKKRGEEWVWVRDTAVPSPPPHPCLCSALPLLTTTSQAFLPVSALQGNTPGLRASVLIARVNYFSHCCDDNKINLKADGLVWLITVGKAWWPVCEEADHTTCVRTQSTCLGQL